MRVEEREPPVLVRFAHILVQRMLQLRAILIEPPHRFHSHFIILQNANILSHHAITELRHLLETASPVITHSSKLCPRGEHTGARSSAAKSASSAPRPPHMLFVPRLGFRLDVPRPHSHPHSPSAPHSARYVSDPRFALISHSSHDVSGPHSLYITKHGIFWFLINEIFTCFSFRKNF